MRGMYGPSGCLREPSSVLVRPSLSFSLQGPLSPPSDVHLSLKLGESVRPPRVGFSGAVDRLLGTP